MSGSIRERLQADMITAMKAKEKERLGVVRMLISKLKDATIEARAELDDEQEMRILLTYAKQREEGLAEARKHGREDIAVKEQYELDLVRSYLPEPLSEAALAALVDEVVRSTGAVSMKDMGRVMKEATAKAAGRADGGRISAAVKSRLGS